MLQYIMRLIRNLAVNNLLYMCLLYTMLCEILHERVKLNCIARCIVHFALLAMQY